ncbi:TniQ family protein [Tropicibacter sp. Alg240-R139]|uniref:TniQ family protein n=1 Tax=Tropicibacter sp. Alg240-R139 TaxID=2305991 RepID=UPI0013E0B0D1|nr:TniQ family protein [Tropicibacter sp. Alg240-R139]
MSDELLSSWIGRLAKANYCSVEELCGYLGLGQGRELDCAGDLRVANSAKLCRAVQRPTDEIAAMTLPDTMHHDLQYVSRHDFQYCPGCVDKTPDLVLRHWRLAWSMTCETCGQAFVAKYPAEKVSDRLLALGARGAQALKTAVATNDLRRLRRIDLSLHVMTVLGVGHLGSLNSRNQRERLMGLAAVNVGTARPLLGSAIILRGNDRVVRELRRAFPQRRRVVERIKGLSRNLDRRLPELCATRHQTEQETQAMRHPSASESALQAARQAISELGPDANRQALVTRADAIWRCSSRVKS